MAWAFETPKALPSIIHPSTTPHPLIIPKQLHRLGTKHLNLGAFGGHSHSAHHKQVCRNTLGMQSLGQVLFYKTR